MRVAVSLLRIIIISRINEHSINIPAVHQQFCGNILHIEHMDLMFSDTMYLLLFELLVVG